MDTQTEEYFANFNELFRSNGWTQLLQELEATLAGLSNIEAIQNEQDLFFRKGQALMLTNLLSLETQVNAAQMQAEEDA